MKLYIFSFEFKTVPFKLRFFWDELQVDFATNTRNYADANIATGRSLEMDSIRTAEAATSITKDAGNKSTLFVRQTMHGYNCFYIVFSF